jgi:hypothetical protein
MATVAQQLGAYIYTGENVSEERLRHFADVGGRWIVPVTRGDDVAGPKNLALLPWFQSVCKPLGVRVGIWANYWGEDAAVFADAVAKIVHEHNAGPVVLDCESSVQENTKLSGVMLAIRKRLPTRFIFVSTNALNDSCTYNGRIDGVPQSEWKSARRLGIRIAPQWCYGPAYQGCWVQPVCNFKWLKENGMRDNLHDASYKDGRAVALASVHPTIEATGMENANLAAGLEELMNAKALGLKPGFSYYVLDADQADADMERLRGVRGTLFLV